MTLEITQIIYEFHNTEHDTTNGVYVVKFNNEQKVFIRNNESVGVVSHYLFEPASKCVSIIRDDVKQEFFNKLNEVAK
jgi:hypothetical protein